MMGSTAGDLWSAVLASEEEGKKQEPNLKIEAIYQRRRPKKSSNVELNRVSSIEGNRASFVPGANCVNWRRSLSTRGRTSIEVGIYAKNQQKERQVRRKKPAIPKGKAVRPPDLNKEKEYFDEVDAFELLEESPSPKNFGTWATGNQIDTEMPHLASRLEKWLISKRFNRPCGPSSTLSKILGTSAMRMEPICDDEPDSLSLQTPEKSSAGSSLVMQSGQTRYDSVSCNRDMVARSIKMENMGSDYCQEIEAAVKKLSLASTLNASPAFSLNRHDSASSIKDLVDRSIKMEKLDSDYCQEIEAAVKKLSLASSLSTSPDFDHFFAKLLEVCNQSAPSKLLDVFSKFCEPESIVKLGEGTYGEAFRAGQSVCKIVPIDGDFRVNGEIQKRSEELLEEVILSRTLNQLREDGDEAHNSCTTFIETLDLKVCQGPYDPVLVRAWEEWDEKHGSENDHPDFPEKQCYVVFVLKHGGQDLEKFVLFNFDEARSLLAQLTTGMAVAESAFEFEHRDLHWGNILLGRDDTVTEQFVLEGKPMLVKTFGLRISIIDFTLSRMNTGEKILFLDLSSDPDLFKGPKGDKQSETYRKMKAATDDSWEGSFPRTNVLWLIYLVDILLVKKSFERSSKNERELRSLKKRLEQYQSAKEAIADPFFNDMVE